MSFVKIPGKSFEMMDAPVTQKQWTKIMGSNPSYFKDKPNNPVESVSWDDAQEFIKKLNARSKKWTYRLPTEEEWEYCCRAGTTTEYYFGDDESLLKNYAWYYENSDSSTQPVKQKKPNSWGLYDMSGNVWEWTSSLGDKAGRGRVLRGGSWFSHAQVLRSAFRNGHSPGGRYGFIGFRLVRTSRIPCDSYPLALDLSEVEEAIAKLQQAVQRLKDGQK